jgi:hypothetical protein
MKRVPLPNRPYAHVLGELGERFVISHLPAEWITRQINYDYGLDLNVERVENGHVTGKNFSVQVKAVENRSSTRSHVAVRLKVSTLAYMKERPEPVLLVLYVHKDKEAYWIWAHEIALEDLERATVNVSISTDRRFTQIDWAAFSSELLLYFRNGALANGAPTQTLERFGRYSIDLSRKRLIRREDADQLENLIGRSNCSERDVQMFIEQHPGTFVGGEYVRMHAQIRLERPHGSLIPDFLLEHVSGLCDIMELKSPQAIVVAGTPTRRRYSRGVHEGAAQTRVYRDFFDDAERREWFEGKYQLRAFKPRTILLIGRDSSFRGALEKRELETALHDYRILTYDDLLRIARAQQVD